jgi:putative CocE/NonD family hydrolase
MSRTSRLLVERDLRVPMRDGVELAADVHRPDDTTRHPVLLELTPYDRGYVPIAGLDTLSLIEAGYAIVTVDCRGRFGSGGTFTPFVNEAADGVETIAWCAAQPWSDGQVGMIGGSYVGATQWLPAGQNPPALKAIAPVVTSSDYHEGWVYQGGAFQLGFSLRWSLESLALPKLVSRQDAGEPVSADIAEMRAALRDMRALYRTRPLRGMPLMRHAPWYDEWLAHPSRDAFWTSIAPQERYATTTAASLNIAGWYDIFADGTFRNFAGMRAQSPTDTGRRGARLVVGPWSHSIDNGIFPERHYGSLSGLGAEDPTTMHRRFFDRWLRGIADGTTADDGPAVRLFLMGADRWQNEDDWPPNDAEFRSFYLRGEGRANTARGDGRLSGEPPRAEEPDAFLYDPRDPVPTHGGATLNQPGTPGWNSGPWDQRPLAARADVLVYTSTPLERPLTVIGPVEAVLFVSSSALDTDFTAKLVDVHPSGRAEILADGILRMRYRHSLAEAEALEPGAIEEIRISVGGTANVFKAGHRIRLDVSSSNFPRFDANTNTGGTIADEGPDAAVPALNRVFHDSTHPSRLVLPVVERGEPA